MNDERLDLLLHRYLDGALNERELAELERRFLAEPQSRTRFWRTARLHAALREWGSRDWGRQLGAAEPELEETEPLIQHLTECLDHLAPQARRTIELRYRQAHKPAEVARLMGWTAEAVYVALARARVVLRECIERKQAAGA